MYTQTYIPTYTSVHACTGSEYGIRIPGAVKEKETNIHTHTYMCTTVLVYGIRNPSRASEQKTNTPTHIHIDIHINIHAYTRMYVCAPARNTDSAYRAP